MQMFLTAFFISDFSFSAGKGSKPFNFNMCYNEIRRKGACMMDFKTELGQKVQTLRESKGLSRQAICGIEDLLTTRQLQRIEKGQSLPTIATAKYIAEQLGVSLDALTNQTSLELPAEYLNLKYQLRTLYHYGDQDRLHRHEEIIEDIYENYFDNLPEEEKLSVQVAQATVDMIGSKNPSFDQGLLDEYLEQAMKKKELSLNDVEIIKLRLLSLALGAFDQDEFIHLVEKILLAIDYFPLSELEMLQNTLISAAGVLAHYGIYGVLPDIVKALNDIMTKRHDFQDNIFVYALNWKVALFIEDDLEKAKDDYQKVCLMADLLSEDLVKRNMQEEWKEDLAKKGLNYTEV